MIRIGSHPIIKAADSIPTGAARSVPTRPRTVFDLVRERLGARVGLSHSARVSSCQQRLQHAGWMRSIRSRILYGLGGDAACACREQVEESE